MIDKDLSVLANIAQIFSVVAPVLLGIYAFVRRTERKQIKSETAQALLKQQLQYMQDTLDKQFGGNSGGIREAINNMNNKIDKIENRVDCIVADLANVTGKFEQHIEEN